MSGVSAFFTAYSARRGDERVEAVPVIVDGDGQQASVRFVVVGEDGHASIASDEDGNEYSIVGAVWGGFTVNAQTGGSQSTFTGKLQIVSQGGGTVDSVNVVFHVSPNGDFNAFDFGTCELPAE